MPSENVILDRYIDASHREFETAVEVTNLVTDEYDSRGPGGHSPLVADAIAELSPTTYEVVEAKRSFSPRAIGQVLLCDYFYTRERQIVQEKFEHRQHPWDAQAELKQVRSHISPEPSRHTPDQFSPKPEIESIDSRIVFGEYEQRAVPLLASCQSLGIDLALVQGTSVHELTTFQHPQTQHSSVDEEWLRNHSASSLDDTISEQILSEFPPLVETEIFRAVELGTHLYPEQKSYPRADAIVQQENIWWVIEVVPTTGPAQLQSAIGQAVSKASIFRAEWGLDVESVVPIVRISFDYLTYIYYEDRYNRGQADPATHNARQAYKTETEPLISFVAAQPSG